MFSSPGAGMELLNIQKLQNGRVELSFFFFNQEIELE
jgi:hypothetical protein